MTLPTGWVIATLNDLSSKIGSGATPRGGRDTYGIAGVPLIRSMNVHFGAFRTSGLAFINGSQAEALDNARVQGNDVLLNITGASIGRVCVAPTEMQGARVNQHVCIIRVNKAVCPRFIEGFLASPEMQRYIVSENYGITRQALTKGMIEQISTPLPPAPEQRRIVAKLDALTARLARARAELDRMSVLAEDLRGKAVLAAMRGDLTARWREANPTIGKVSAKEIDTAYHHIAGDRRRKPALPIDWKPEIAIPPTWRWASVDELVAVVQYGTSAKTSDASDGIPVLRMGNIQRGLLSWTNLKYLPTDHDEFPSLWLTDGDVLFNRTNSPELVGKSAVFRSPTAPVSFASYLIRLRCTAIIPDLLVRYLNSPIGRSWIGRVSSQQVGQANVNGTKLKSLGVPLPSFAEQIEINRALDTAFARADRLEAEAARARALLDRLESAILAKAFRGELVPQDPADEPASVLLDRIRAERAAAPQPKRGRRASTGA